MTDSSRKSELGFAVKTRGMTNMETIVEAVLEKQRGYLETRFNKLQQMGEGTEEKLRAIQTDLLALSESIGTVNVEMGKIRLNVENNSERLVSQEAVLETMKLKLADMEDRIRRCNVRITGLPEGLKGSNAVQFLTNSLPKWFSTLGNLQGEIMHAHRVYSDNKKKTGPRTLIFNVLRYTTRQQILRAAKKTPLIMDGRRTRFSPDYSSHTVKRRQAFSPAMNTVRARGVEFFLLHLNGDFPVPGKGRGFHCLPPGFAGSIIGWEPRPLNEAVG